MLGSCSIQQEGFHCSGSIDTQQRSYLTKSRKETVIEASNSNYASRHSYLPPINLVHHSTILKEIYYLILFATLSQHKASKPQ